MELQCVSERKTKLLSILRRELRLSDGLVRRLKPLEPFRVNGERAHTDRVIFPGDEIRVLIEETAPDFPPEDGGLHIVYEDEALIVLDKPAGILVHPSSNRLTGTLANRLLGYYLKTGQKCAVHVLTRLDRDTKGLVVYAKNAFIHALMMEELEQGLVEKTYLAETVGAPEADSGSIELPIGRLRQGSLLRCVREDGKYALTEYRVLNRTERGALLALKAVTGRTHQLRVHCSYSGFPIAGDPQYGGGEGGQALIAARLRFRHPMGGTELTVYSPQGAALLRAHGLPETF